MDKSGIEITIPHFAEPLIIRRIVVDYTGTLSIGGKLSAGVDVRLRRLKELVEIDVLSADSFGTAHRQLASIPLPPQILQPGSHHDEDKEAHVKKHTPSQIAAFGNGNNDALMLKAVKAAHGLAVAVDNGEGCSVQAMLSADIFIMGITNALDLLLEPTRCKATLRK
jgi:soluble P-type ATPase